MIGTLVACSAIFAVAFQGPPYWSPYGGPDALRHEMHTSAVLLCVRDLHLQTPRRDEVMLAVKVLSASWARLRPGHGCRNDAATGRACCADANDAAGKMKRTFVILWFCGFYVQYQCYLAGSLPLG